MTDPTGQVVDEAYAAGYADGARQTGIRFRTAAELVIQDVRARMGDRIASLVEESFGDHFARAEAFAFTPSRPPADTPGDVPA